MDGVSSDDGRLGMRVAAGLLIALPVLVFLMVGALIALSELESSRATEERLASAARVAATQVSRIVASHLEQLQMADETLGDDPAKFTSQLPARREGGSASIQEQFFILVYSADGNHLPAQGQRPLQNNIAANPDFQALARGEPWVITPMIVAGPAGARSFAIARRLERNGAFAGVAVSYVSADILFEAWLAVDLGPDSSIGLMRTDGWLVTRFPVPDEAADLSDYVLFTEYLPNADAGTYSATSPLDSVRRRVAYLKIEDLPLVVVSSMSRSVMQQNFWRRVRSTAFVAAPVGIALVATCLGMIILLRRERASRLALQSALSQNRMLFQEIHHRVKNNLQTVAAMIRLQPGSQDEKDELSNRIAAMTAVHQHMYESNQFETLQVADYIDKLVHGLREGYGSHIEVQTRLDPLEMPADRALTLGLLVNELVSNAFKHAFPDGRAGLVSIELRVEDDGQVLLTIRDNGVGSDGASPGGMGTRLIRGFADRLGGQPRFRRNGGTEFELRFPRV